MPSYELNFLSVYTHMNQILTVNRSLRKKDLNIGSNSLPIIHIILLQKRNQNVFIDDDKLNKV